VTTVCWDLQKRLVAVDGRIVADYEIHDDSADKRTVFNDVEFFLAGSLSDRDAVCRAFVARRRKIRKGIYMQALAWDGETLFDLIADEGALSWHPVATVRGAIGSGSAFALAALDQGATPRQAILAAIKRDAGTGGKVVTHKLIRRGKV
jgi:hypothetical protein